MVTIVGCGSNGTDVPEANESTAEVDVVQEAVRACDIMLVASESPTVKFSAGVQGHWSRRGDELAISFIVKDDSVPRRPLFLRGKFKLTTVACYDGTGAPVQGEPLNWT